MARAVFISNCGDPFLLALTLKMWKKYWYDEVDRVYINTNNNAQVPRSVISELLSGFTYEPKVHAIYHPIGIGNGMPITEMTLISKEDYVMLLEDDGYIFTKGKVDECFKRIENGEVDLLGSPRGSCGKEVWDNAKRKYSLDYSGYGDVGPTWWPNFLYCKRSDLLKTDMNFGSKEYTAGTYYEEIDHRIVTTEYSDTFAWASLQLRYLGVRSVPIPQFHASPTEPEDKMLKLLNWKDGEPYWLHGGSLSAGWGGYLNKSLPPSKTDMEKREIESRCAFWTIACDTTEGFEEFKKEYKAGIANLINKGGLESARVQDKVNIYRSLMKI